MKTYEIELKRTEYKWITVQADNKKEAIQKAEEMLNEDPDKKEWIAISLSYSETTNEK